jgi:hypothetical protein
MRDARRPSTTTSISVRSLDPNARDRRAVKAKVIDGLRALSPALVASGAIVDARAPALTSDLPPRPSRRTPKQK